MASETLSCELNSAPKGMKFTKENTKDYYKKFEYLPVLGKGKIVELKDVTAKVWLKNDVIHLELIKKQSSPYQKALSYYPKNSVNLYLRMNDHIDFHCTSLSKAQKAKEKVESQKFEYRRAKVTIVFSGDGVVFPLDQPTEQEGMRVVYYQKGQQYFNYNQLNKKIPWCAFRIKTLVRKTVVFYPKDKFKPTTFMIEKNDKFFDNYHYGFVNKNGELTGGSQSYYPFSFNCQYFSGLEMTPAKFSEIVGTQIRIK